MDKQKLYRSLHNMATHPNTNRYEAEIAAKKLDEMFGEKVAIGQGSANRERPKVAVPPASATATEKTLEWEDPRWEDLQRQWETLRTQRTSKTPRQSASYDEAPCWNVNPEYAPPQYAASRPTASYRPDPRMENPVVTTVWGCFILILQLLGMGLFITLGVMTLFLAFQ